MDYTPKALERLHTLPFQKRLAKVVDFMYEVTLSNLGEKRMERFKFYDVVGRPGSDHHDYFSNFFYHSKPYEKSKASFAYALRDDARYRLEELVESLPVDAAFFSQPGAKSILQKAEMMGRSFHDAPLPRSELNRTGDRVYPWWVLMKITSRRELFVRQHGVLYDYDISNAKPALMLQAYDKVRGNKYAFRDQAYDLSMLREYVTNKKAVRQQLQDDLGWTSKKAKTVLHAICNGAYVSGKGCLANENRLLEHPIYAKLRQDYQLQAEVMRRFKKDGESSGQMLSREYMKLEDTVMSIVEQVTGPQWWCHDGWMAKSPVDTAEVEHIVKQKTGLDIELETNTFNTDYLNELPHRPKING